MQVLKQYFDQIYLINLERRPDKLIKTLWLLNHRFKIRPAQSYNTAHQPFFIVWTAVDGYHPTIYAQTSTTLPPGAYGYLLTWQQIIQDAQKHNYQRILIFDDDIRPIQDFSDRLASWLQQVTDHQPDWKVLLLGASQHQVRLRPHPSKLKNQNHPWYQPRQTDGSFATALHRSIFQEILTLIAHRNRLLDSDVLRTIYQRYPHQSLVAKPNLIMADVSESDIRPARDEQRLADKLGWQLDQYYSYTLGANLNIKLPMISILIPCYNAEKTIQRCLTSLYEQTYRPLEIILVNDGSSDASYQLVSDIFQDWLQRADNYHLITQEPLIKLQLIHSVENQGCYRSRNKALQAVAGQFVGFHDADDVSVPHRFEEQLAHQLRKGVAVSCCQFLRTHLTNISSDWQQVAQDLDQSRQNHHPDLTNHIQIDRYPYCCRPKIGLVTALFRREIVQQLGEYLEWPWGADDEYIRRLFPEVPDLQQGALNYDSTTKNIVKNATKKKKKPMQNFLNDHQFYLKKYARLDQVMYLSYEMTAQNLTSQRLAMTRNDSQ